MFTVEGLDDSIAIAGAERHTCALRKSGAVACWGRRELLGTGDSFLVGPTKVRGVSL